MRNSNLFYLTIFLLIEHIEVIKWHRRYIQKAGPLKQHDYTVIISFRAFRHGFCYSHFVCTYSYMGLLLFVISHKQPNAAPHSYAHGK